MTPGQLGSASKTGRTLMIGLVVAALPLIICIALYLWFQSETCDSRPSSPTPRRAFPTTGIAIRRPTGNPLIAGYDWLGASDRERLELCEWLDIQNRALIGGSPHTLYCYAGLEEFYSMDEPSVLA